MCSLLDLIKQIYKHNIFETTKMLVTEIVQKALTLTMTESALIRGLTYGFLPGVTPKYI